MRIPTPLLVLAAAAVAAAAPSARAGGDWPLAGTVVEDTGKPFDAYVADLKAAVRAHGMGIVAEACATCGAAQIGVRIPGNRVVMVYHPRFAVRMLEASVPAGIEAPLRLYLMEAADGTATLAYRTATAVFAPYGAPALDALAAELDAVLAAIARDAAAR